MRALRFVAWPLQTAFARASAAGTAAVLTARIGGGGCGSLCSGFHSLGGLHLLKQKQGATRRGGIIRNRGPRRLIVRCLNRIMIEPSEVARSEDGNLRSILGAADARTAHVRSVLKAEEGQSIRVGVVDGGIVDDATIAWREPSEPPQGAPPADIPGRNKDRKAAAKWRDLVLDLGANDRLLERVPQERRPKVALMLALPRPLQLERILPMVSSLGVTTLVLCTANKVEKMYFGSHLFRDPHSIREKLVEGLSQCGDTILPEVVVVRRLKVFLADDLERLFPKDRWVRTVAHPTRLPAQVGGAAGESTAAMAGGAQGLDVSGDAGKNAQVIEPGLRLGEVEPPKGCDPADAGVLVTVGPEGGWEEPHELDLLQSFGFQAVTLGPRVLRSDVAVCALLALAHAWVEERAVGRPSLPPLPPGQ